MASASDHELQATQPKPEFPPRLSFPAVVREISISRGGGIRTNSQSDLSSLLLPPDPSKLYARIFVVQGSEDLQNELSAWIEVEPEQRRQFLLAHLSDNEDAQRELSRDDHNIFFMNWVRLARQGREEYEIERRIVARRPYDVDTTSDPSHLHLNHKRYYRWPSRPWRPYEIIAASENAQVLYHAVKECISVYSEDKGGVFTALLLLDPVRYFRTFDITFDFWHATTSNVELEKTSCFLDDQEAGTKGKQAESRKQLYHEAPMKRLIALLERQNATMKVDTPRQVVRSALAQLMSDDLTHILGKMTHTLDEIELSLHDDLVLQRSLPVWRRQLGRWRNTLFHQGESLRELHQGLLPETAGLAPNMRESLDPGWDKLLRQLQGLSQTVDRASRRVETVFQALMSSMSIVESERAIAEAEVVSKLTHLAFFFIPLSLVAGIFGMNINEFQDRLTWWHWLVVSIAASAATYALLYRAGLVSWIRLIPVIVRSFSIQRLSRMAVRWLSIINSIADGLPFALSILWSLGFLAGLGVGTWKLVTSGALSVGAKVAIAIFAIWLPFLIMPFTFLYWRRRRAYGRGAYYPDPWTEDRILQMGPGESSIPPLEMRGL